MKKIFILLLISFAAAISKGQPGTLINNFGNGGKTYRNIGDSIANGGFQRSSVLQADGKLIVPVNAGTYCSSVLRIKADGKIDSSYGVNGYGAYISGTNVYDVALQTDGKVVVAGVYFSTTQSLCFAARYTTAGILDTTFNHTGFATRGVGGSTNAYARAVAIQTDGKIVIAGGDPLGLDPQMAFYRFNSDGSRDGTFSNANGKFVVSFGTGSTYVTALAIQKNGKIIGVGPSGSTGNTRKITLVRLFANGTLDNTFDGDGEAFTQVGNTENMPYSITLQTDGKIVVAGRSENYVAPTLTQFAFLCRYDTTGTLDNNFNGTGIVHSTFYEYASVKIQPADGKIVAVGDSTGSEFGISRYNSNGTPDINFRYNGNLVYNVQSGLYGIARSLNIKTDGTLVLAGYSNSLFAKIFPVLVLTSNGFFDISFTGDGVEFYPAVIAGNDYPFGIKVTPSGKIFMAGETQYGGYPNVGYSYRMASAQFKADGTNDSTYNKDGRVDTCITIIYTVNTRACAVQPDDKKLIAGYYNVVNGNAFFVKRLLANGFPDASFGVSTLAYSGTASFVYNNASYAYAYCMALQDDGKIVVAGDVWNGTFYVMGVARFKTNGTLDSTFGSNGIDTVSINTAGNFCRSIAIQNDGRIVLGGYTKPTTSTTAFALVRLNANGGTDNNFGNNGRMQLIIGAGSNDYGNTMALQADGKIVIAGDSYDGTVYTMGIARVNSNGTPDNNFNSTGSRSIKLNNLTTYAKGIAVQDDNKILVGGLSTNGSGKLQFALARLTATGSIDNTFGTSGIKEHDLYPGTSMNFGGMTLAPNKIYLAGYAAFSQLNDFVAVAMINDAGPLVISSTANTGICPGGNTSFASDVTGASYQWQVDNGNGVFTNLTNASPYSTVTTNILNLTAPATGLYGYKFRAFVNGNTYSQTFTLKFASSWTGTAGTAWETPGNWSCGAVPDANTDVYISSGKPNYPSVNSTRSVRSVHLQSGATMGVAASQHLTVTGK